MDSPVEYLDKNFFLSTQLDLAIYNPTKIRGSERRAFLGITLEGKEEDYICIPIADDLITTVVGLVQNHIKA